MEEVFIVSGCRTPMCKFLGSLSTFTSPQLGALTIGETIRRSGLGVGDIDEVIMGNVITAGLQDRTPQGRQPF